jgi:hypothetical protein
MIHNLVKYLVQTRLHLWDIKITSFKPESCPDDLLEIFYFYISQTKSSLEKIFYVIVYHHIIYICDFFCEFRRLFLPWFTRIFIKGVVSTWYVLIYHIPFQILVCLLRIHPPWKIQKNNRTGMVGIEADWGRFYPRQIKIPFSPIWSPSILFWSLFGYTCIHLNVHVLKWIRAIYSQYTWIGRYECSQTNLEKETSL